jgi:hypothetical protein
MCGEAEIALGSLPGAVNDPFPNSSSLDFWFKFSIHINTQKATARRDILESCLENRCLKFE